MVKLIGALLSLTMLFGSGATLNSSTSTVTANVPVTVGKQQAVYEKYENISTSKTQWELSRGSSSGEAMSVSSGAFSYDIFVDKDNGAITYSKFLNISRDNPQIDDVIWFKNYHSTNPKSAIRGVIKSISEDNSFATISYIEFIAKPKNILVDVKGLYLTDITADNGSLPADGKHTDGFWYVCKNLVED